MFSTGSIGRQQKEEEEEELEHKLKQWPTNTVSILIKAMGQCVIPLEN